jgi:tetratricopeptide (TPR) repeat protein
MSPGRGSRASRGRRGLALLGALAALAPGGCGPADPLDRVRELHAAGRFEDSLEPLRELLESGRDDAELHYLYGLALAASGNPSLALFSLRKAMESPEWLGPAGLQLANGALRTGNFDAAIETLTQVLEAEPENERALVLRAYARAFSRRDYEGTLADAERALDLDPDLLDALVPRAVALLGLGRVEEAGAALEELERRFGEDSPELESSPELCAVRASFAKEKGDLEAAERLYGECLERFGDNPVLVQDAIEFFDRQRRPERSTEILRQALEKAPLARGYRVSLVLRLGQQGKDLEAEEVLREATELDQPLLAADAWADLGGYYFERREFAKSAQAYEQALELVEDPPPQLLFTYADALVVAGEHEKALELSQRMSVPAHRELVQGRVYLERGEPAKALAHLSEGLRTWPENAIARYYAARAAEETGDFERAIEEYRYSIRSGPGATDARLRLARLHVAEGADSLALAVLTSGADREPSDVEMALLELELLARLGRIAAQVPPHLAGLVARPEVLGRAVAAMAAGTRARSGPAAAADLVRRAQGLDLTQPQNAAALRERVLGLAEAGEPDAAQAALAASLAAQPESAAFHAIRGLALERSGAAAGEQRTAFERALALEGENAWALAGLARLHAAAQDQAAALAFYERAAAADPQDASLARAAAQILIAQGRSEEAEKRLEELLERHPYDGVAALRLAELRAARGADPERTRALAQRAARFGGGSEARELLARLPAPAGASGAAAGSAQAP